MADSRGRYIGMVIIGFALLFLYYANKQNRDAETKDSIPRSTPQSINSAPVPRQFAGYACTGDCSGHEAGYRWAEEKV
jgi:hypothetical protein